MNVEPVTPRGIWVEYEDGSASLPLPVRFVGYREESDGALAEWVAELPDARIPNQIHMGTLPARTSIILAYPYV